MTLDEALQALQACALPGKGAEMRAYHKAERRYLGVANPDIDALTKAWRQALSTEARVGLADALWQTDIHEARIAAAKLFTQARIRPDDDAVWQTIVSWVPSFDAWAVADHASIAGQKRLVADPTRLDLVETWTQSEHLWTRRAALVMTLPWTKQNHPKPAEEEARDRILGWAAGYVSDQAWFIQKAIAWWLRELSKHDPERARAFLDRHGPDMKGFAAKEAGRHLS